MYSINMFINDIKQDKLNAITKNMAWVIGKKPYKMLKRTYKTKDYTNEELDTIMFTDDTFIELYVARSPYDEAKYGPSFEYILLPAGITFKDYYEIVNKFYSSTYVQEDDLRFQTCEGKKLIGNTYLSNLGNHVFYEGHTEYLDFKYEGHNVISFFALGS